MRVLTLVPALLVFAFPASAQLRTMKPDDYKGWEAIAGRDITNDGRWLWYQIASTDSDGYVVVKNNDDSRHWKIEDAAAAAFSDDSQWCAYLISPPKAEADKLREDKKPVFTKLGLRNLATGDERVFDSVAAFKFLKGSHTLLADRFPSEPRPEAPTDVLVIDLGSTAVLPVNGVTSSKPNEPGTEVAFAVKTGPDLSGLELLDTKTMAIKSLEWGKDDVSDIAWAKNGSAFAFLLGHKDEKREGDFNQLEEVTGLPGSATIAQMVPADPKWLPDGSRISDRAPLELNEDGTAVAFGIGDWWLKSKPDDKAHPEVWNSKDLRTVPEQRVSSGRDRERTDLAVWWPAKNSVHKLTNGWLESAGLLKGFKLAVVDTSAPYRVAANNGWLYSDFYLVDTMTGERKKVLAKTHWGVEGDEAAKYLTYYQAGQWWIYDIETGKSVDATLTAHATFEDSRDDHTTPEKPPAEGPTWLADDKGVVFQDEFDSWLATPQNGTWRLTRLTKGRKDNVVYRFIEVEDNEDGPSIDKPFYFSILDRDTKNSGYYVCDSSGKGKTLALDAMRMIGLKKAKNGDRMVFSMGSFVKSPDLYITNTAFTAIKPESKTNPQQSQFLWPKSELVTYKSRWGLPLQGILIYPADYVKGKQYPMITLIYERLSDNLFSYVGANDANAYNTQIFAQNGYFVFEPDIAYKGNTPGQNAVDCLEPAVKAVLDKNVGVNPGRIGLMGHSWGAYQTAFVTTVSPMFRVGAAGAPLTDLVSMYNTYYWNSGSSNAPILETSQGRLRVPFWEDPKAYIDNSPVWQSTKRKAPLLITVGDQDGAVDFHQGIALYSTLRRMGKDCILLVYYGENHNFTKHADQVDYAHRLRHFMDVYLKDAKPEPWISQGIPFIKREED
jgi:dipeptidyl aminopeptidase/acylaminoacyl peptidase